MKIKHLEVIPVCMPFKEKVRIRDSYGWKEDSDYNIIRIRDEEGREGIGEATFTSVWSGETQAGSKEVIENILFPVIRGKDYWNIEAITQEMDKVLFGHPASKAAIEMAVYDLLGKNWNVPIYQLLGGKVKEKIAVKFSISAVDPDQTIEMVQFALDVGIKNVKVKVGTGFKADIARVKKIHEVYGESIRIAIDANNALRVDEAKRLIEALEDVGLLFVEQPVRREDLAGMVELRQFSSVPIVVDEGVFTPEQAWASLKAEAADIYSVYPGKNGGIGKTKGILEMVKAAKKIALIGSNLELGIASASMIHVGLSNQAIDNEMFPSDIIGPLYHKDDVIVNPIKYQDGYVICPKGSGLGVSIDEDKLNHYRID